MQKEKGIVSIKVKLLGVIVPVVIVSILVLVLIAYRTSAGLIESYSENLLESSVENQASQIEGWLEQNIGAFQIARICHGVSKSGSPTPREIASFISWTTSKNFRIPDGWIVVIVLFNGSLILHLYPFIFGLLCHYGSMILILLQDEVGLRAEHGIQRGKLIGHEL